MTLQFVADIFNESLLKESYVLILKDKHFLMSIDNDIDGFFRVYTSSEKLLYLDYGRLSIYLAQFTYDKNIEIKIKWDGGKDFRK